MKTNYILTLFIVLLFCNQRLLADSPLTSTDISQAYKDSSIVQLASELGYLNNDLLNYLSDNKNPIDLKIAVINKLGWASSQKKSIIFFEYLKEKNDYQNIEELLNKANGDILICMAYLKALDNYFSVDEAIIFAKKAKFKSEKSYTINIICALIEAQKAMHDDNWCEVFNLTNNVRLNKSLNRDMNEKATGIIFEYMDLYKNYCK